ncbi:MAG: hypothetical protein KGO93_08765 [Cyanobacteria bacterium REEB446]|nr:hypothetical protein [Cyanobacteria bacterium REEB446]
MASVKISSILNNREEYFAILRSLTNDPQAQLDLESNKHRSQLSSFNLKNVLRSIDLNSNNQIEKDEFEQYHKSIVRQGCLILKYFKNPYRRKSGQICKVMSQ